MPGERTDEEIARHLIMTAQNPCGEYLKDTFGDSLWPKEIEALAHAVASALRTARAQGVAEEREACAKVAALFTVKEDASIYPGVPFSEMNDAAQTAAHTTAQQIAAAIRSRSSDRPGEV